MKKTICICICICLMSGCGKSLNRGSPASAVVEDTGSEGVSTHSLTSNASASEPSNTPAPTPEPSKSALSASDTVDIGISVVKIGAVILSVIVLYCGVYKPLYGFADIEPVSLGKYEPVEHMPEGCKECYFINGHFFDWDKDVFIEEIPVNVKKGSLECELPTYYYKPNLLKPNLLKTLLRKIFRIKIPVSVYSGRSW